MRLLTYTFVALVAAARRRSRAASRARGARCGPPRSPTFAVSALHLSQLHQGDASWPVELLGHHASLPLAFAILYQDYPFALADLFLKRALTLLGAGRRWRSAASPRSARPVADASRSSDPREVGMLVTLWVGTALLYPGAAPMHRAGSSTPSCCTGPTTASAADRVARRVQTHEDVAGAARRRVRTARRRR